MHRNWTAGGIGAANRCMCRRSRFALPLKRSCAWVSCLKRFCSCKQYLCAQKSASIYVMGRVSNCMSTKIVLKPSTARKQTKRWIISNDTEWRNACQAIGHSRAAAAVLFCWTRKFSAAGRVCVRIMLMCDVWRWNYCAPECKQVAIKFPSLCVNPSAKIASKYLLHFVAKAAPIAANCTFSPLAIA